MLQPFLHDRSPDCGELLLAPPGLDPFPEVNLVPVAGRPGPTVLAGAIKLLQTKMLDQVLHPDSAKRVCFVRVNGQSPTSDCALRSSLCFVLVKCAYLPFPANTLSSRKNVMPTEHPNGGLASVYVQIQRAILFPRLPQYSLL